MTALRPRHVLRRISGGAPVDFASALAWEGVQLGDFLPASSGLLSGAIERALRKYPSERRFIVPPGDWPVTPMTETQGLRSNLIFDGIDRDRCRLFNPGSGQMFLWQQPGNANLVFRNLTFDFPSPPTQFSASLNASNTTNYMVEYCRFLCSFTGANDGIRHQIGLHGGKNLICRFNHFVRSQPRLSTSGVSTDGVQFYGNLIEDCNDLGISCVGGDLVGSSIRNVQIFSNVFRGLMGSGFIYVGGDALTGNPSLYDIDIYDNICGGVVSSQVTPAGRIGITISLGPENKRISVRNNTVTNDTPGNAANLAYAIAAYVRDGTCDLVEDLDVTGNRCGFLSANALHAILVDTPNGSGVDILDNIIRAGSRGIKLGNASHARVRGNRVFGSTSTALELAADRNAVVNVDVERNLLQAGGAFKPAVFFTGSKNASRIVLDTNRLESPSFSALSTTTGSLDFRMRNNSVNAALHSSAVPTEESGTVTE